MSELKINRTSNDDDVIINEAPEAPKKKMFANKKANIALIVAGAVIILSVAIGLIYLASMHA